MLPGPLFRPEPQLMLLKPPYEEFVRIDTSWKPDRLPARGLVLVWWVADPEAQASELEWLYQRPWGIPLIIVLPPPQHMRPILQMTRYFPLLHPRAILPTCSMIQPERIRHLLTLAPRHVTPTLVHYLQRRRLLRSETIHREVERTLELATEVSSIARLSKKLRTSRRTLGRHCLGAGLPVPSHWLQFGRLMHVAVRLQMDGGSIGRAMVDTSYPDAFTMSNQMKRLIGCRPSEARRLLGWEWLVECWIAREARAGRIDPVRHGDAIRPYLESVADDAEEEQTADATA